MKFAFAGTPDFAAWVLGHLLEFGRRPCLVVSQPDRPQGRGRKCSPPATAVSAQAVDIPCLQVEDINDSAVADQIAASGATVLVVAAFGQILRPALLDRFLCLNIHGSLLPAYRGAAPIERALAAGERTTGVSIMRMAEGLDEGPWALQKTVSLGTRDDAISVTRSLALLGSQGMDQVMTGIADGNVLWTEQEGEATYASKLSSAEAVLTVGATALDAHNTVRAFAGGLGAKAKAGDVDFKVWRSWPFESASARITSAAAANAAGQPGAVRADKGRLFVGCVEGALELLSVQPAGKSRMPAADFLRGYGSRLGENLTRLNASALPTTADETGN